MIEGEPIPYTGGLEQLHGESFVVIASGRQGPRKVNDEFAQAAPCIIGKLPSGNFYLGVFFSERDVFFHTQWSRQPEIINAWRALRLAEKLPYLDNATLSDCWEIWDKRVSRAHYSMRDLAPMFGGDQLESIRDEMLRQAPETNELERMILAAQKIGLKVDGWELKREIENGSIVSTPLIDRIIKEAEEANRVALEKINSIRRSA